jgi:hypothetical protein
LRTWLREAAEAGLDHDAVEALFTLALDAAGVKRVA